MSTLRPARPVKTLAALFGPDPARLALAARRLEDSWGPLDYASELLPFDQTDYYRTEMGAPLFKRFVSAETLMNPADLVQVKIETMRMEWELASGGRRSVNIDPGYLAVERLILATGKNQVHRVYLAQGVYADLTLLYESGGFKTLPWTYPDYATTAVQLIMTDIRKKYLDQLKLIDKERP